MDKIEKMFLDLNSALVKFWIEQGRPDKETKIALLERMLNWYKKMGYVTPQTLSEGPDKSLEEEIQRYLREECSGDDEPTVSEIARHFAEWQKQQMMDEWLKDRDGCFWDGVNEGKKAMEEQMMKDGND